MVPLPILSIDPRIVISTATRGATSEKPVQPKAATGEYKQYSIASKLWGEIPVNAQPIRVPDAAEARERIIRNVLDTPLAHHERNPWDWAVSLLIHAALIAAVIIVPMWFTQVLDLHHFQVTMLEAPRPPAAAPAPAPPAIHKAQQAPLHNVATTKLTVPVAIPKKVYIAKDEAPPEVAGGVVGGIPGGASGGVLGGILGGMVSEPAAPPPAPAAKAEPKIVRVGGNVKPPQLLLQVPPHYPTIAINAHIDGKVIVDAIIDEDGNVVKGRAVRGPVLLYQSAVEAVMQWKYQPTLLNGQPVALSMEVEVIYRLRASDSE